MYASMLNFLYFFMSYEYTGNTVKTVISLCLKNECNNNHRPAAYMICETVNAIF